jgi:hypothetical protein
MMNNRALMGEEMLRGGRRALVNTIMIATLLLDGFCAGWAVWTKSHWVGVGAVAAFIALAVIVHFVQAPRRAGDSIGKS